MLVVSTHVSDHRMTNALKAALSGIDAPGWAVVSGDRLDMIQEALKLHYQGIKLAHVQGGDTVHGNDGHPDHRTRDALSMLARVHFVANEECADNLYKIGISENVFITGNPGLDEVVEFAKTKRERTQEPFYWFAERGVRRLSPDKFLLKLATCKEFITNSSAGILEATVLNTPVVWVGDRQKGRSTLPHHHPEGKACEVIANLVREYCK